MTQWKNFSDERPPLDVQLRLEVKEKDRNTDTPYFGKPLFKGYAVFDGRYFYPFGLMHPLPIFWNGRLDAFGREDVTARYAPWEDEE